MLKPPVIAIVILTVGAGASLWFGLETPAAESSQYYGKRIPMELAGWRCLKEEPPDPEAVRILGTDDILTRIYFDGTGRKVTFLAVFANNNRRATHPPEICLRGAGRILEKTGTVSYKVSRPASGFQQGTGVVAPIAALTDPQDFRFKELIVRMDQSRTMVVNYWFKTGRYCTCNSLTHEWHLFKNNVFAGQASNSLLEVTTDVREPSPDAIEQGRALVHEFVQIVYPYVIAAMP